MVKAKKWGVILCILCLMPAFVSVPAGAAGEDEAVTGIEVEPPSAAAPQSQGRADIEEYFTETDGAADDEDSVEQVSPSPGCSGRELPIIYDQQQSEAPEAEEAAEAGTGPQRNVLLLIIPAIAILALPGIFYIHRKKARKGEKK